MPNFRATVQWLPRKTQTDMEKYDIDEMIKFHLPSRQKKTASTKTFFIFPNGVEIKAISKKIRASYIQPTSSSYMLRPFLKKISFTNYQQ